jgi:hypothetical protein
MRFAEPVSSRTVQSLTLLRKFLFHQYGTLIFSVSLLAAPDEAERYVDALATRGSRSFADRLTFLAVSGTVMVVHDRPHLLGVSMYGRSGGQV